MIWFTSDTHFDDEKTLVYRYRPFENVKKMNEALIETWNTSISPEDDVFHLGDFAISDEAIKEFAPQLNGNIRLILGNHDDKRNRELLKQFFDIKEHPITISFEYNNKPDQLYLCHYPKQRPNPETSGIYACCGHIHDLWKVARRMVNVGVDAWHFKPVSLEQIISCRQAEEDGHWDANVYPDAPLKWQWAISNIRKREGDEPTINILKKELNII
jgi:calcineurin-like phosphoesterase family protein